MQFIQKYTITTRYLPSPSARRRGYPMNPGVRYVVAHDTGNPNSTASQNVAYFYRTANPVHAEVSSAHLFVDDNDIIECVPVFNGKPEMAWHVRPQAQVNNLLHHYFANEAAVGIEYCYGTNIDPDRAYRRYVWLIAYVCHTFKLDPARDVVGHCMLDPHRKTDPVTGLLHSRRNYTQLLLDVVNEYHECRGGRPPESVPPPPPVAGQGQVRATVRLHVRRGRPSMMAEVCGVAEAGEVLDFVAVTHQGDAVNGNPTWYKDEEGNYFWGGGTAALVAERA